MKHPVFAATAIVFLASPSQARELNKGTTLIDAMIQEVGSMDELRKRGDVEYTYVYETADGSKRDVSVERYRFDGELSWAKYTERSFQLAPELEGQLIQGWDGKAAWVTLDGKPINDEKLKGAARFLRKTNFYWFAMMPKLRDPGIDHSYQTVRTVDGVDYELVKATFDDGVGDAQDTYLLYINPKTKLVDRFLFTVAGMGVKDPLMMVVEYKDVDGVKLPVERKYTRSNWDGEIPTDAEWTHERMKDIRFRNGFKADAFAPPGS